MSAKIRAELEECREWLRGYGIEAEKADTDPRYKAGRVDAISFALVMLDNLLDEPRIWDERPNEGAASCLRPSYARSPALKPFAVADRNRPSRFITGPGRAGLSGPGGPKARRERDLAGAGRSVGRSHAERPASCHGESSTSYGDSGPNGVGLPKIRTH